MIKRIPLFILASVALLIFNGCSQKQVNQTPTLADLANQTVNINPAVHFEITPEDVIDNYQALVDLAPIGGLFGKEKQRLADLQLESGLDKQLDDNEQVAQQGDNETQLAINHYQQYLKTYPSRPDNDKILYQLSRAYAINVEPEKAQQAMQSIIQDYPNSSHIDEVQFRRGEHLFVASQYRQAEVAYKAVVDYLPRSPYYEKALYKYAWAQFKQNNNQAAIASFLRLLDIKYQQQFINEIRIEPSVARSEQELINDTLRVISLSLDYLGTDQPINNVIARNGQKPYEAMLYRSLSLHYEKNNRYINSADNYLAYVKKYPLSPHSATLHQHAIEIYQQQRYSQLLLKAKHLYVNNYNVNTAFWSQQSDATQSVIKPLLIQHIKEIATHYYAVAKASKKRADFKKASQWYQLSLDSFPNDPNAAEMNFLLAESLYDGQQYRQAINAYETTAYQYPKHKNSAEAGYAAIVGYSALFKNSKKPQQSDINEQLINSSIQFAKTFPNDARMPNVLLNTAENFFNLKRYQQAIDSAQQLTLIQYSNKKIAHNIKLKSWALIAHSSFELQRYHQAEDAYTQLLTLMPKKDKKRAATKELVAASIYKQGEIARQNKQHLEAAQHFLRLVSTTPYSNKRVIAEYDAATEYIALKDWDQSIKLLENFRKKYAKQKKWTIGVAEKLALAYLESGEKKRAAKEMLTLSNLYKGQDKQDMLWQSAQLYEETGNTKQAITLYKKYIKLYPNPLAQSIETRHKIALYHKENKQTKSYHYWLNSVIAADAKGAKQRSNRSRSLAANARLALTQATHQSFTQVKLTTPLKKSLKRKKQLMQKTLKGYSEAAQYQIASITNASTFHIAQVYNEFASALLNSERPKKLNEDELEEYNYLLEDQAFPFEEKAINIHQKNLVRLPEGNFDESVKSSLQALSKLLPFRYAKTEKVMTYAE